MALELDFSNAENQRLELTREQQEQIKDLYEQVSRDIAARASKAPRVPSDVLRKAYLDELQKRVNTEIDKLRFTLQGVIEGNMGRVAEGVVADNIDFLQQINFPIEGAFSHVPAEVVERVATGQLYSGNWTLSRQLWKQSVHTQKDVNSIVAKGIAENKSAYDIAKDLETYVDPNARKDWSWSKAYPGTAKKVDYNAQRLARTMVSHAYQQAFVETTRKNPFVTKYQWEASNSDRTCELCAERDGQYFDKDDLPLDHPNGMCTFVAVMEESMDQIAERLGDWVNGYRDPELDEYAQSLYGEGWEGKVGPANTNPDNLPQNLVAVLGPKGEPIPIEGALITTNPMYSDRSQPYAMYHHNCQRCVCAFELQRRGYAVEALPFDGSYPSILQTFAFDGKDFDSYVVLNPNSKWDSSYEPRFVTNPNHFGYGASSASRTIVDSMTRWGDGSRAALIVQWKTGGGHVVNVENTGGQVRILDGQNGKSIEGAEAIKSYMGRTIAANSELIRLDQLAIRTDSQQQIERIVKQQEGI